MSRPPELADAAEPKSPGTAARRPGGAPPGARPPGPSGVVAAARQVLQVEALPVLIATVVLAVVIGVLRPRFLTLGNLHDVLQQSVYVAILAAGLAFLIGMREIDLSVGSVFGLTLIIG